MRPDHFKKLRSNSVAIKEFNQCGGIGKKTEHLTPMEIFMKTKIEDKDAQRNNHKTFSKAAVKQLLFLPLF